MYVLIGRGQRKGDLIRSHEGSCGHHEYSQSITKSYLIEMRNGAISSWKLPLIVSNILTDNLGTINPLDT